MAIAFHPLIHSERHTRKHGSPPLRPSASEQREWYERHLGPMPALRGCHRSDSCSIRDSYPSQQEPLETGYQAGVSTGLANCYDAENEPDSRKIEDPTLDC